MRVAILLDLDDTIHDTETFRKESDELFNKENLSEGSRRKWQNHRKTYRDLDGFYHPQDFISRDEWRKIREKMLLGGRNYCFEEARDFVKNLDERKYSPIIFTFGDANFQEFKRNLSHIDLPMITMKNSWKGKEIAKLWQEGFYEINREKFAGIVLIDDREKSFHGFENLPNARGFLMNRKGSIREIDKKNLSKNVKVVESFYEIKLS